MKQLIRGNRQHGTLGLALLVFVCRSGAAEAAIGDHRWSVGYDAQGGVALDAAGNVGTAGTFFGPVDFGGGTFTPVNFFGGDVYLARLDGGGSHLWSRQITPGGFGVIVGAVAAGPTGELYVGGTIQGNGTIDFGGGALSGSGDVFLAAFDAAGTHLWSTTLGSGWVTALAATSTQVVCTGYTYGTMDFGSGPLTTVGGADAFLAAYTAAGAPAWGALYGDAADQGGLDLAVDGAGQVILAAGTTGTVDFGGGPLAVSSGTDLCVASFSSAGAHTWSTIYPGTFTPGAGILLNVAVDAMPSGDIALAGEMSGSVDLGGGALTSIGSFDAWVAVLDATGAHQWSIRHGGSSHDGASGVAFDTGGNVVVSGIFLSTNAEFGGGSFSPVGIGQDFFAAVYDPTGAHLWSASYGQNGQYIMQVDCDPADNPVFFGGAAPGLDFGGGPLANAYLFIAELEGATAPPTAAPIASVVGRAQCFPNPFRPSTTIAFTLDRPAHATLEVVDVQGRRVAQLTDRRLEAGRHAVPWNARGVDGRKLRSGVYFYRLRAGDVAETGKMVLVD